MLDDSRLIHDFHRGGRVPDGLRTYLLQDHWLYVARAEDGRVVRLLEDMVTREAGLAQQVRSAAKAEAFAGPLPAAAGLCAPTPRHACPHPLEQVKHGFGITALSGTNALASLSGTDAAFVVNLGRLAARAIVLGTSPRRCRPCRNRCSEPAR